MYNQYNQIPETTKKLIDDHKKATDFERSYNETREEKIKVHQVSSRLAFLYEKIRNVVDYNEEHLLRKKAIERILKRRLMTEKSEYDVAKFLIYELVRAGYLPNNKIPVKRIEEVKEIIEKYTLLINKIPQKINGQETDSEYLFDWIVGIASCEIEEKIVPYKKDSAMVEFACQVIDKKLKVSERLISEKDRKIQIYIAILRSLAKSDISLIRYRLFSRQHPEWFLAPSEELITKLAENINRLVDNIEKQINHPLNENFLRFVKRNLAYFTTLQDVISNNQKKIDKIFSHHLHLEDAIKEACTKKYKEAKIKLRRAAIRSILYIFITKMILAFIIELPFDKYILGHINYISLSINMIFPPLLMFLVVVTIKIPSRKNTELIVTGIKEMIYDKYMHPPLMIKRVLSKKSFFYKIFKLFYLLVFIASFSLIILILRKINFNVMSIILFLFFLSVVSYFGIRIRQNARELVVVQKKEGIIAFLTDLFSIPIIQMGQWLSVKLSSINIFVFVLDFIIEAPFKTFVEIFEEWIYFIKEEKDKIY
jgi:transcription termination factor NusB